MAVDHKVPRPPLPFVPCFPCLRTMPAIKEVFEGITALPDLRRRPATWRASSSTSREENPCPRDTPPSSAVQVYSYIARRRERDNFLAEPLLENRVLNKEPLLHNFAKALSACQSAEALLRHRHHGILPPPATPISYMASQLLPLGGFLSVVDIRKDPPLRLWVLLLQKRRTCG